MSDTQTVDEERKYHHGDLRNAVINAALGLLEERGVEGVTLRQCAARAGVSHGAPGHHFGDLKGVLTAIAVIGFERLADYGKERLEGIEDPQKMIIALGTAYVGFALSNPSLFSLMFQADRLNVADAELRAANRLTYDQFARAVELRYGSDRPDLRRVRMQLWSGVHGYASLLLHGTLEEDYDSLEEAVTALFAPIDKPHGAKI